MSKTRQRQIRSLSLNFSPGHRIAPHAHEWHQLLFATQGVLNVSTEFSHWIVPPSRALWISRDLEHSVKMSGAVAMHTLYFHPGMRVLREQCCALSVSGLMRELIVYACDADTLNESSTENRALIQLLISQLKRMQQEPLGIPMPSDPRGVAAAQQILEVPTAELSKVSEDCRVGLRTLQRIFTSETGISLGRWRRNARLLGSLTLLEQGRSVTDVALDLGFESLSAFISLFKRFFGVTPAKYFTQKRS